MLRTLIKGLLFSLFLLVLSEAAAEPPQRRWVTITNKKFTLPSGDPVFFLILRGHEEFCGGKRDEQDPCFIEWSKLPSHLPPPLADEVEYWIDSEVDLELIRVKKLCYCAVTHKDDPPLVSCDRRWEILLEVLEREREDQAELRATATA